MDSFATIPTEIRRRVAAGERVALIMLDGLGAELLARHERHPFVRRLALTPLRSQFPATTTAHVTTMHYGLPVQEHGLYEWNIFEPSLGEMICPLLFDVAGGHARDSLAGRLDPDALAPGPTLYETLGCRALVVQPHHIDGSTYTAMATRGADRTVFADLSQGVRLLLDALDAGRGYAYGFLYWDRIDAAGHEHGPDSLQFADAARAALDALELALGAGQAPSRLSVLLCADHGQVTVSPDRVDYLDELWPQLPGLLSQPRPAGSSRDAFLHVVPGARGDVIDGLRERLGERARVLAADELFDEIGPRLRARLGDVAVLPAAGRQAWLRSAAAGERWFRGHHGGLEERETATYLAELVGG
ncbi:MAG TPA: alkaline phosphatase family protein [Solirubrobacteraceae bacterium]|nr:alkaline phosphatase family protein [Solirubrobacteraceae bacterium]